MRNILLAICGLTLLTGCNYGKYEFDSYQGAIDPLIAENKAKGCSGKSYAEKTPECRRIALEMQKAYDDHHAGPRGSTAGFRYIILLN